MSREGQWDWWRGERGSKQGRVSSKPPNVNFLSTLWGRWKQGWSLLRVTPNRTGTLVHYWWEYKLVQPLWKTVGIFLKKLEMELLYNSVIPLTHGHIRGKDKNSNSKRYMHPSVHCSTIYNSQTWKQPKYPWTDEWIKMWYIFTMEYYSAIKNEVMPFTATWWT